MMAMLTSRTYTPKCLCRAEQRLCDGGMCCVEIGRMSIHWVEQEQTWMKNKSNELSLSSRYCCGIFVTHSSLWFNVERALEIKANLHLIVRTVYRTPRGNEMAVWVITLAEFNAVRLCSSRPGMVPIRWHRPKFGQSNSIAVQRIPAWLSEYSFSFACGPFR